MPFIPLLCFALTSIVGIFAVVLEWVLCEERYPRDVIVQRLQVLAQAEVKALEGELVSPEDVRMHSCGVDISQIS